MSESATEHDLVDLNMRKEIAYMRDDSNTRRGSMKTWLEIELKEIKRAYENNIKEWT